MDVFPVTADLREFLAGVPDARSCAWSKGILPVKTPFADAQFQTGPSRQPCFTLPRQGRDSARQIRTLSQIPEVECVTLRDAAGPNY